MIKAIVFDFDGVFTDNRVLVSSDGTEYVMYDKGDAMYFHALRELGIKLLVLTSEESSVVDHRCRKIGIDYIKGAFTNKLELLCRWLDDNSITSDEVVYVGNDINDIECMKYSRYSAAPSDAYPEAIEYANILLKSRGGYGAVREICKRVLD